MAILRRESHSEGSSVVLKQIGSWIIKFADQNAVEMSRAGRVANALCEATSAFYKVVLRNIET